MPDEELEVTPRKIDTQEEIIREEMKESVRLLIMIWRTGLTVLPAVVLGLFALRSHFYQIMIESGELTRGMPFPWGRWLIGTFSY